VDEIDEEALKMEPVCFSETFVSTYKPTRHYYPEEYHRYLHHHQNLKYQHNIPINCRIFFQGNELAYIYACLFLGFVPIVCAGAGYGVVKLQNRRRRRLRMQQEELKNNAGGKTSVDKMAVREWLHANHRRLVKVKFGPEAAIHTVDRKGEKLRTVNFRTSDTLTVEESQVGFYTYHTRPRNILYVSMCNVFNILGDPNF
jgi:hypothetical protein